MKIKFGILTGIKALKVLPNLSFTTHKTSERIRIDTKTIVDILPPQIMSIK